MPIVPLAWQALVSVSTRVLCVLAKLQTQETGPRPGLRAEEVALLERAVEIRNDNILSMRRWSAPKGGEGWLVGGPGCGEGRVS